MVDDAAERVEAADEIRRRPLALEDGLLRMVAKSAHGREDLSQAVLANEVTNQKGVAHDSHRLHVWACIVGGSLESLQVRCHRLGYRKQNLPRSGPSDVEDCASPDDGTVENLRNGESRLGTPLALEATMSACLAVKT